MQSRVTAESASAPDRAGHRREKRIVLTALASIISRAATMLLSFSSVPLLIACLGKEQYGILMAITSIVTVLGFSDLGLGNSVMNALAEADGHGDRKAAADIVASGFAAVILSVSTIGVVLLVLIPIVPLESILRAPKLECAPVLGQTLVVVACCVLLNTVLSLVQRIELGHQRGYEAAAWQTAGTLVTLLLLVVVAKKQAGMPLLAGILVAGPTSGVLGNVVRLGRRNPWLIPKLENIRKNLVKALLASGSLWLVLQIAHVLGTSVDTFLAARLIGPQAAADFSVHTKLLMLVPVVAGFVQQPLWPAYREALASGDADWVKRTVAKAMIYSTLIGCGLSVAIAITAKWVIPLWVGKGVVVNMALIAGLATWTTMYTIGNAATMYLHAKNEIRIQCIWWGIFALAGLIVKVFWTGRLGVVVLPWANVSCYALAVALPTVIYFKHSLAGNGVKPGSGAGP